MKKTPWKIRIVYDTANPSLGGHGTHLAFRGLPGVEIVALADANCDGITERLAATDAARHYTNYQQMIEQERPDVVVFGSRIPVGRVEQLEFVIRRGCHVLCEKPLAGSLEDADRIVALGKEFGVKIAVAHLARYAPVFQEMKRRIESGMIGRPLSFYGRGKEDHRGGGEDFLVLGTHILDIGCFLFGSPEFAFADIMQAGKQLCREDRLPTSEPLGVVAGDEVAAYYRFANGVRGFFESRRNVASNAPRMGVTVVGTQGMLSVRYDQDRNLRFSRSTLPLEDETVFETVELPEELEIAGAEPIDLSTIGFIPYFAHNNRRAAWDLLNAISEDRAPLSSAADAQMVLEMIQGAYTSSLTGSVATIPLAERKHPLKGEFDESN